ncbi:2-oxoglutarate-dependent dioxygenase 19 [Linum perenne]
MTVTDPFIFYSISKVLEEYSSKTREVAKQLLIGISESLGLRPDYISDELNLEEGMFQLLAANFYPPCPQPELAMGMAPHSDHGLVTLLVQNGVDGLQVHHRGEWVNVENVVPGSFLVNTGDHLEVHHVL